jgi:hypothetical protein
MKEKIKEINDYFVNKLVNGEYVVQPFNGLGNTTVLIDDYRFDIWTANDPKHIATNQAVHNSFMHLKFTESEKSIIYSNLKNYMLEESTKQKLESYNKLKEELGL